MAPISTASVLQEGWDVLLQGRMIAALAHDCIGFFDAPQSPRDTAIDVADWMISAAIQQQDLYHWESHDAGIGNANSADNTVLVDIDEMGQGNNPEFWRNFSEGEDWRVHIVSLMTLRDSMCRDSATNPRTFAQGEFRISFFEIIEDVRYAMHDLLEAHRGLAVERAKIISFIKRLCSFFDTNFPYNSSAEDPHGHAHRYALLNDLRPHQLRLCELAGVAAKNLRTRRRRQLRADEGNCQCQLQLGLLKDTLNGLRSWIRDGTYGSPLPEGVLKIDSTTTSSNPMTKKLVASRDLACGLINGREKFSLTWKTVIEIQPLGPEDDLHFRESDILLLVFSNRSLQYSASLF